jgi:hypothetical protein
VLLPLSGGRISVSPGQQVGLLETMGAKSGEPRTTPLLYLRDDDRVVFDRLQGRRPAAPVLAA